PPPRSMFRTTGYAQGHAPPAMPAGQAAAARGPGRLAPRKDRIHIAQAWLLIWQARRPIVRPVVRRRVGGAAPGIDVLHTGLGGCRCRWRPYGLHSTIG